MVRSFDVGERVLEIALPRRIGVEAVSRYGFAGGVEAQKFGGDFAGGALGAILDALPLAAAQPGQRGRLVGRGDVCAQAIELFGGHVETVIVGVFQDQILPVLAA